MSERVRGLPSSTLTLGERTDALRNEIAAAPPNTFYDGDQLVLGQPRPIDIYTLFSGEGISKNYTVNEIGLMSVLQQGFDEATGKEVYDRLLADMTPEEIITRLSVDPVTNDLYALDTEKEAFTRALGRGATTSGAGLAAMGTAGALGVSNPYLMVLSGLFGSAFADAGFELLGSRQRSLPNRRNLEMSGQFVGGAPFLAAPYMAPAGAISRGAERLLFENIKKTPYLGSTLRFVTEKPGQFLESGFEFARRNPKTGLLTETGALASGAGFGYAGQEILDPTAVNPSGLRLTTELVGSVVNPVSVLQTAQFGYRTLMDIRNRLSPDARKAALADNLVRIFDELRPLAKTDEEVAQLDLENISRLLGENSELDKLLAQYNIDPSNPTAAQKTGNPVLAILQSSAAKNDPAGFGARIQNNATSNMRMLEKIMAALLELDTPPALQAFAQVRDQYYNASLEAVIGNALRQYQDAAAVNQRLSGVEAGEGFIDTTRSLQTALTTAAQAARKQEQFLYDQLPMELPTEASNFLQVYRELQDTGGVGQQGGRFDSGKNRISIDAARRDFEDILEKLNKEPDELLAPIPADRAEAEAAVEEAGLEGMLAGLPAREPLSDSKPRRGLTQRREEQTRIVSRDLYNLRRQVLEALRNEKRGLSSSKLSEDLEKLELALQQDIRDLLLPEDQTTPAAVALGKETRQRFDNALQFTDAVNNTFNTILTGIRSSDPFETSLSRLINNPNPAVANVRLNQIDTAVQFLEDSIKSGQLPTTTRLADAVIDENLEIVEPDVAPSTFFEGPRFGDARGQVRNEAIAQQAEFELFTDLVNLDQSIRGLRSAEERTVRAIFSGFQNADGTPNNAAIDKYLADPVQRDTISQISPPEDIFDAATGTTIRQSPLLNDLLDVQKRAALFKQLSDPDSPLISRSHQQIPLAKFLGVTDNPGRVVGEVLGQPGSRPANPISDFRSIARAVASGDIDQGLPGPGTALDNATANLAKKYSEEDLKKALYDATVNQAYTFANGGPDDPFSFARFRSFLNDPILPGKTQELEYMAEGAARRDQRDFPSPLQILKEEGIIDEAAFRNFETVTDNAVRTQDLLAQLDADPNNLEALEGLTTLFAENPISIDLVTRILGANLGTKLSKILPGAGDNSLIAAAAGSQALRNLTDRVPRAMFRDIYLDTLTDPALMKEIIDLGRERQKQLTLRQPDIFKYLSDLPLATKAVATMRALLIDAGIDEEELGSVQEAIESAQIGFSGFFVNPIRQASPGEEAAQRRQLLRGGFQPPAMIQRAQQLAPQLPPVAQAPANPQMRQRYAAAYPQDFVSDIIRTQGIGSLVPNA